MMKLQQYIWLQLEGVGVLAAGGVVPVASGAKG